MLTARPAWAAVFPLLHIVFLDHSASLPEPRRNSLEYGFLQHATTLLKISIAQCVAGLRPLVRAAIATTAASMTPQSASGAGKLGDEEVLPEHDQICSDEENDIIHDFEGPSVSKVAVRWGSKHILAPSNSNELTETISAIDAADAKSVHVD
jgi:hypothetical protein